MAKSAYPHGEPNLSSESQARKMSNGIPVATDHWGINPLGTGAREMFISYEITGIHVGDLILGQDGEFYARINGKIMSLPEALRFLTTTAALRKET